MIKPFSVILISLICWGYCGLCQTDSVTIKPSKLPGSIERSNYRFRDSSFLITLQAQKDSIRRAQDSVNAIQDSIRMAWIKIPDPNRPNKFIDSLVKLYTVKKLDFEAWAKKFPKSVNHLNEGRLKPRGEIWVLGIVVMLILFYAVLKQAFSKEITIIVQAFYSNRVLGHISKEENLFSSWPFVFLYILFGFTIGIFLYLCSRFFQLTYSYSGFNLFIMLSVSILILFTFKIITLRCLAFLFDIQWMVKEYISILYLSYFNAAILFLPLVIAFSLSPLRYAQIYIYAAFFLIGFIFIIQFLRIGTNILTKYRFSKIYLFIYLCALEVCPLLVLIKALRF